MYVLYAENAHTVRERSVLFERHMEPMLKKLDAAHRAGQIPVELTEVGQYLEVCRWPFRKLEYAFALEALLPHLKPGDRYLDAGCGVTPLAAVLGTRGVRAEACDYNRREIELLQRLDTMSIYGTRVTYTWQDLTNITYAEATFDAVSCISVIEHIPAPQDQVAVRELMRVLKPGGILVVTLDYAPPEPGRVWGKGMKRYLRRAVELGRRGDFKGIGSGFLRRVEAQQAVARGAARQARSANQCFGVEHLCQDIEPALVGQRLTTPLPYSSDLLSVTSSDARHFWSIGGIGTVRDVLPVAFILRK
jgi:SAM-dependent methyltransferase